MRIMNYVREIFAKHICGNVLVNCVISMNWTHGSQRRNPCLRHLHNVLCFRSMGWMRRRLPNKTDIYTKPRTKTLALDHKATSSFFAKSRTKVVERYFYNCYTNYCYSNILAYNDYQYKFINSVTTK